MLKSGAFGTSCRRRSRAGSTASASFGFACSLASASAKWPACGETNDLNTRIWAFAGVRTKNGHPHSVPLSDPAVGIIEQALADAGDRPCLFALPPVAVARFVERAQAKFGIMPAWVAHDPRRTARFERPALGVERVGARPCRQPPHHDARRRHALSLREAWLSSLKSVGR